jgi:predicted peptidase
MSYLLYLPPTYATSKEPCPVLVFLHGGGEVGEDLAGIFAHGPNMILHRSGYANFRATFPFIVISPQCPPRGQRWDQPLMIKATVALIRDLEARLPWFDKDRVYLTGLSMGGKGTWFVGHEAPELFAAMAPMSASTNQPGLAEALRSTPVWMVAGERDQEAVEGTQEMEKALDKISGVEVKRTVFPHTGHEVYDPVYQNAQFYEWLLQHRRSTHTQMAVLAGHAVGGSADAAAQAPHEFGHHAMNFPAPMGDRTEDFPYTIFLPKAYSPAGAPKPLILFLHEQMTIGMPFNGLCLHGPDAELERKGNESFKNSFQAIVVSPQRLPQFPSWGDPAMSTILLALLDDVCGKFRIDGKRIFVSGLNEGAVGAWRMALQSPDRLAALLPVMMQGKFSPPEDAGETLATLPIWSFMPAGDTADMQALDAMFKESGADWKLTGVAESDADPTARPFQQAQLYEWLLGHHRE